MEMIIDIKGREIKLLIGMEVIGEFFFYFRVNVFPDFESKKSKSGSSLIIAYPCQEP